MQSNEGKSSSRVFPRSQFHFARLNDERPAGAAAAAGVDHVPQVRAGARVRAHQRILQIRRRYQIYIRIDNPMTNLNFYRTLLVSQGR